MAETTDDQPPFQQIVKSAVDTTVDAITNEWGRIAELHKLNDPVFVKNTETVLVYVNDAFARFWSPDVSPVGRSGDAFLDPTAVEAAQHSDELIAGGATAIDFDHFTRGADGRLYRARTHKESLARFGNPGLASIGITRVEGLVADADAAPRLNFVEMHRRFRAFDETDREICQRIGRGKKVREIAEALSLTSRAVEQRKKKILDTLELEQTLDLVKLLVRLQDRGFVDLGL